MLLSLGLSGVLIITSVFSGVFFTQDIEDIRFGAATFASNISAPL
jgi:hypothetical protein